MRACLSFPVCSKCVIMYCMLSMDGRQGFTASPPVNELIILHVWMHRVADCVAQAADLLASSDHVLIRSLLQPLLLPCLQLVLRGRTQLVSSTAPASQRLELSR